MEVVLDDVPVMYVESASGIQGAPNAFSDLESRLPSLSGRKFYGTLKYPQGTYRACVALQEGDDPSALGLPTWVIPGGKFARQRILDWSERPESIGEAFGALAEQYEADPARPSIEFYRSKRELVLFLPIR